MQILFISHDASRTGAPVLLYNLIKLLKEYNKYNCELLLKNGGSLVADFQKLCPTKVLNNKEYIFRNKVSKYFSLNFKTYSQRKAAAYIKKYDIIISNTITNGDIHWLLNLHPFVYTYVHELEEGINLYTKPNYLDNVLIHTKKYLYPSEAVKHNLEDNFKISSSTLINLPYFIPDRYSFEVGNRRKVREELGIKDDEILIIGVGTGDWRKAPDIFLQSLQISQSINSKVKGVWVGINKNSIDFRRISYDKRKSSLGEGFIILESLSNPFPIMAASDIFFLSSREDPYPVVVIEAAMMKLPIICFNGSGGANEFVDNNNGFKVPYLRCDLVATEICSLANSRQMRDIMGSNARNKYLLMHSDKAVIEKFASIFK